MIIIIIIIIIIIYSKKNGGPRTDPWGTPQFNLDRPES